MAEENKDLLAFDDSIDPIYKKGFEHGYWLQRGSSDEVDKLIEGSKNHFGYSSGLIAGKKEADREKMLDRLNQIFEDKSKDKDRGLDR